MIPLLVSEYRKFVSTRLWWILLLAMAAYMAFVSGLLALGVAQAPEEFNVKVDAEALVTSVYGTATAIGYVFPVIVGALSVTAEYRYQTIVPTLLATPVRWRVTLAKLLGSLPVGVAFAVTGTLVSTAVGAGVLALAGSATFLGDPAVLTSLARSVLSLTIWILVGVGLGTLLRQQVLVIVIVLVYTQFVEPLLRALLSGAAATTSSAVGTAASDATSGATSWGTHLASFLPGAAGEALTGSSIYSAIGFGHLLPWWAGALVLTAYALAFAGIGTSLAARRDLG